MPNFVGLGWANQRPGSYTGPDREALRSQFQLIERWSQWPHIFLANTAQTVGTGATANVTWTTETDPYQLHVASASNIAVPRDFDEYLAVGVAGGRITSFGGAGRRALTWVKNGGNTGWSALENATSVLDPINVTMMEPVKLGDVLRVELFNGSAGSDDWTLKAAIFFMPMA